MVNKISSLVIHVANVWQTCEWYGKVFGIGATLSADASAARLDLPGQLHHPPAGIAGRTKGGRGRPEAEGIV